MLETIRMVFYMTVITFTLWASLCQRSASQKDKYTIVSLAQFHWLYVPSITFFFIFCLFTAKFLISKSSATSISTFFEEHSEFKLGPSITMGIFLIFEYVVQIICPSLGVLMIQQLVQLYGLQISYIYCLAYLQFLCSHVSVEINGDWTHSSGLFHFLLTTSYTLFSLCLYLPLLTRQKQSPW